MFASCKGFLLVNFIFLAIIRNTLGANLNRIKPRLFANSSSDLRFVAVGDWGSDRDRQQEDANAMGQWCDQNGCDFVLSTGDNFYDSGVKSADDERFQTTWRDVYTHPAIASLTWYVIAGNHDHGGSADDGREWYQVEHSKIEPRWHFPDLAYSYKMPAQSSIVKFVSYDTESLRHDKNNPQDMLDFIEEELQDPDADWKIVLGHHPCYSAGHYTGSGTIRSQVLPIMKKYNADIYLTGHDHNQQHWQVEDTPDIDHIITGAGGKSHYGYDEHHEEEMKELGMALRFFKDDYGFVYFVINENSISWQFINSDHEVLYEHSRYK